MVSLSQVIDLQQ